MYTLGYLRLTYKQIRGADYKSHDRLAKGKCGFTRRNLRMINSVDPDQLALLYPLFCKKNRVYLFSTKLLNMYIVATLNFLGACTYVT